MTTFTRTLTFRTKDLGTDATLMLTFDRKIDGMYNDKFPVCWKVIKFAASGQHHITVTYTSRIAFKKPQVIHAQSQTVENASTSASINRGQKTTLTKDPNAIYYFSRPEPDVGYHNMKAYNGTETRQDMFAGFFEKDDSATPTPFLYFKDVEAGSSVETDLMPLLRVYVTSQYKETQIISGEITSPCIWEENIATLYDDTTWDVKFHPDAGIFFIHQIY